MVERMRKDGLEVRDADLPTLHESMSDLSEFEVAIPKELTLRSLELADVLTRVFLDTKWSLGAPAVTTSSRAITRWSATSMKRPCMRSWATTGT